MERREVRVVEQGGQQIFGVLHLPEGKGPFPVVVVHHGFAGSKIGTQRIYVQLAEAFSRQGIATFRFDFRGCGDSEGRFDEMTVSSLVADALRVIDVLRDEPNLDLNRLGLLGASLGGSVACLVAERVIPRSLALWAPVACGQQWQSDFERTYPDVAVETLMQCGGVAAGEEFCQEFLALRAAHAAGRLEEVPLLHAQGDKDDVVLPNHANLFATARSERAVSQFLSLPNSCHGFLHPQERQQLIGETVEWFCKTLR